jgi:RNA polymerase sigma-70 factor (ECF subfamily)
MAGPQGKPTAAGTRAKVLAAWQQAGPALRRLAAGLGCGASAAEDVLQDVYVAAVKDAARLNGADLRRWLFRVAVNRCLLEHRRTRRWRRAVEALARRPARSGPPDVAADVHSRQQLQAVRQALSELSGDVRVPLVMRYFLEMDSGEIGRTLGLNGSTVRSRLQAGRAALADALRKAGFEHEQ